MFDSIYIGLSGLQGFQKGLKVIGNNVANLNTPGFKSSDLRFADAFYQYNGLNGGHTFGDGQQFGTGLTTLATRLNFQAGDVRQTGNAMDLSISGDGLFMLRDEESGRDLFTRAGQFGFNEDGDLISGSSRRYVLGYPQGSSSLSRISLNGLRTSAAKATTVISLRGNLSSTVAEFNIDSVKVFDALGGEHSVKLNFKSNGSTSAGTWTVTVVEGTTSLGSGTIKFVDGVIDPAQSQVAFTYTPSGGEAFDVRLDLATNVTSFAAGNTSTLAVGSRDGHAMGTLTGATFASDGTLTLSYSNGQTAKGAQLALAVFESNIGLEQVEGGAFVADGTQEARLGRPADAGLGAVQSGQLELSNVDLSAEFSDLIVMQRGYQASSHIVTTANEMIQQLFDMKGQ